MRISVFPKGDLAALSDARTMTVFEWITKASTLPADGLELYSGMFWRTDDDHLDAIGEALDAEGFEMPMLCTSPDFTHPDASVRESEFDRQLEMMRITRRLGGAGASTRVLSGQKHPGVSREQGVAWVVDAYERLLPVARELDITLGMENHYKDGSWQHVEFAQKGDVFREIVDAIEDRVHFGVQFDPSNAITAGMDSADFLDEVIDRVVTMQASDRFLAPGTTLDDLRLADGTIGYSPALQHGVIGKGMNDYPRIFRALADVGYDGWVSIEDGVNGMDEMHESVLFLREAREVYFGGSTAVRVATQEAARAAAGLESLARPDIEDDALARGREIAR
ncbi:sugar phosphate isomerase/epimerase [Microbacterium pseudoresistens]|uniref:Sugar phosphate isomerase/epimerase n=1 Tax=Microbacterium pseudoresistens TaxID=640634 RepID=A0A7Y9JLN4_9MICO|nr:sugar phosphate isomerase/epimerase family protein [Microbacterium pseudoresistens]NYD53136.1 sugar phosphate isomerase/epimerase [Microbacterium pseudoresistens]